MTSYDGLKAALGSYRIVRKFEEKLLLGSLRLTEGGRLDFRRYKSAQDISPSELSRLPDVLCYIIFPDPNLPPIKCRLKLLLSCLNEALAVSPSFLILDESCSRVIEFYRGAITICEV